MSFFTSRRLPRLIAIFVATLLAAASRAEITPEARQTVNRYFEVAGGSQAFQSMQSRRFKASIQALGLTGTTTLWTRIPDRRASEILLGPLKILEGFDGAVAWRTDPGSGQPLTLDGKDLEDARASAYFDNERWLTPDQGGGRVSVVGTEKDSAGVFTVVEVSPPVGRSRRFYFNQKTGLIDRATTRKDQLSIISTFADYRPAGGRLLAFRQLTQIPDMPANDLLVTVDSVWVNESIPEARFRKPEDEAEDVRYLKEPGVAHLPFRYETRHVWLQASVNGGEPANFLYDTGASITIIDSSFARRIGLKTEGALQGQGAGATGTASFSALQSLQVAGPDGDGVELRGQKVAVLSINPFLEPFFWKKCDGVLGYDFISRFVSEIDFDREILTLHNPTAFHYSGTGAKLPFTLAGTVPTIRMKIDGRYEGEFRVDVGSGSTVDLHGPFVQRHGLDKKGGRSIEVVGGGFGGTFRNRLVRMQKIEIGPYAWERPLISLSGAESGALASEDYAGNIGTQILERFKCVFDYPRRMLYLEPGKKFSEPDGFSRSGVQLARYADTVRAMQVLPGSPAAKAGIEEGDVVVGIDGKSTLDYTPDALAEILERGEIGRKVVFELSRDGRKKLLTFRLREII